MARRLARLRSEDRGIAAVELGMVMALLLLVGLVTLPIFQVMLAQTDAGRGASEGLRFATKAQANPCRASDPDCVFEPDPACQDLRRRPSSTGVRNYVRETLDDPAANVIIHHPDDVTALLEPCTATPGSRLAVTVTVERDLGALAGAANTASSLLGKPPMFPEETVTVSTTGVGYLE